jgi:hypothetical protein
MPYFFSVILYAIFASYFAGVMVRLMLTLTPIVCGSQFYWWRKLEYPEKTTHLLQVTDKLDHNVVSSIYCHELNSNTQL